MEADSKINAKFIFQPLAILLLVVLLYYATFYWLYERYVGIDTYYSHGFIIPFVTIFLIWRKRNELAKIPTRHTIWGLTIIIFSVLLHIISNLLGVFFTSGFSLFFLTIGIVLFLYGTARTKIILFPLLFLIFMFPLPLAIINAVSFPMKMLATRVSVWLISSLTSIPIKNEGFEVFFPHASLVVGNPCSGLRSLISLLALGSIFSYFLDARMIRKVALFLTVIPIAFASNIIRIIILSLGVYVYGEGVLKGFFHEFSGFLTFSLAFLALLFLWRRMQCTSST